MEARTTHEYLIHLLELKVHRGRLTSQQARKTKETGGDTLLLEQARQVRQGVFSGE